MRLLMAAIAVLLILYKGIELLNDGLPCLALGCRAHVGLSLAPSGLLAFWRARRRVVAWFRCRVVALSRGFVAATPAREHAKPSPSAACLSKGGGRSGLRPLVRTLRLTCFFSSFGRVRTFLMYVRTLKRTEAIDGRSFTSAHLFFSKSKPSDMRVSNISLLHVALLFLYFAARYVLECILMRLPMRIEMPENCDRQAHKFIGRLINSVYLCKKVFFPAVALVARSPILFFFVSYRMCVKEWINSYVYFCVAHWSFLVACLTILKTLSRARLTEEDTWNALGRFISFTRISVVSGSFFLHYFPPIISYYALSRYKLC